jgi:DNA polymerase-1
VLNVDRKGPQREALCSRHKNGVITQADYGQHELRFYSVVAEDDVFLKRWLVDNAFDPHQLTCDQLKARGVDIGRDYAKNTNFGVIYDVSPTGLEDKYDIPKEQGKILLREWEVLHPALGRFRKKCIREIFDKGYVESVFGMRRHARDPSDRHEQRSLINFLIQHPAAFICFVAMLEAEEKMRAARMKSVIDMQVHDSIRVDTHPKELSRVKKILKDAMLSRGYLKYMVHVPKHPIPLAVDIKVGEHM